MPRLIPGIPCPVLISGGYPSIFSLSIPDYQLPTMTIYNCRAILGLFEGTRQRAPVGGTGQTSRLPSLHSQHCYKGKMCSLQLEIFLNLTTATITLFSALARQIALFHCNFWKLCARAISHFCKSLLFFGKSKLCLKSAGFSWTFYSETVGKIFSQNLLQNEFWVLQDEEEEVADSAAVEPGKTVVNCLRKSSPDWQTLEYWTVTGTVFYEVQYRSQSVAVSLFCSGDILDR